MTIKDLCFSYGEKVIFDSFNLEIPDAQVTCIMGGSGSGKTTLLNCISGILDYGGKIIYGQNGEILQKGERIAYVFQQPRLIPSMTVKDNIKYALNGSLSNAERESVAQDMISKMQLDDCALSYPKFISGGQASRAALARAFAVESKILLMDEPFKGLDIKLKKDILTLLFPLVKDRSVVFVTHDVEEALAVGDVVYVLRRESGESARAIAKEEIAEPREERDLYGKKLNAVRQSLFGYLTE